MPILERILTRLFPAPPPPLVSGKRTLGDAGHPVPGIGGASPGFAAGQINKQSLDFLGSTGPADQDLYRDNVRLRARARQLAQNDPFVKKYLQMVVQNVVGTAGILMQAKVKSNTGADTAETKRMNLRIEEEWDNWCQRGSCTADGKFSWVNLQQMAIKNWAREGENLVKFVYGLQFNPSGFALQPLDNDQLDDTLMSQGSDGSQIRMGVEVDQYRKPQAYHLWDGHPRDQFGNERIRRRIPAEICVHTYISERPAQTRGYTQLAAVMMAIQQYNGYNQAELVAARFAAAKFLAIEQTAAEGYVGDDGDEDEDADDPGAQGYEMGGESGALVLPAGQKAIPIDWKHPTQAFESFSRTAIRNVATGLLVSYPTLGNDLSGVNFSSIRAGLLDERDSWRILQIFFIDHFMRPIFDAWLKTALLTTLRDITLSPKQMRQIAWNPRGWAWVDPLKDGQAALLEIGDGLNTRTAKLAERGLDFETVIDQLAKEEAYIKSKGLTLGVDLAGDQAGKGVAAGDEDAAAQVEGAAGKGGGK